MCALCPLLSLAYQKNIKNDHLLCCVLRFYSIRQQYGSKATALVEWTYNMLFWVKSGLQDLKIKCG
jgi:hypothetical protein